MLETFTLDRVPEAARLEAVRAAFASYPIPVTMRLRETGSVEAHLGAAGLGDLRIERFDIRGLSGHAARSAVSADDAERALTLHRLDLGAVALQHGERQVRLGKKASVLTDTTQALEMHQRGHAAMTTLTVPHERLGLPDGAITAALSIGLGAELPVTSTITGVLRGLAADMSSFPDAPWQAMEHTLVELMRALVLLSAGDDRAARAPLAESLAIRILAYIDHHALDQDLSAERVAAVHNISTRYLYVILSRQSITLRERVRTTRLRHAAGVLREEPHTRIADIAHRCGFADHAHFARLFRSHWGMTPSEWRDEAPAAGQGVTTLRPRARSDGPGTRGGAGS
jgi:AraC-like DNA-binding protein